MVTASKNAVDCPVKRPGIHETGRRATAPALAMLLGRMTEQSGKLASRNVHGCGRMRPASGSLREIGERRKSFDVQSSNAFERRLENREVKISVGPMAARIDSAVGSLMLPSKAVQRLPPPCSIAAKVSGGRLGDGFDLKRAHFVGGRDGLHRGRTRPEHRFLRGHIAKIRIFRALVTIVVTGVDLQLGEIGDAAFLRGAFDVRAGNRGKATQIHRGRAIGYEESIDQIRSVAHFIGEISVIVIRKR